MGALDETSVPTVPQILVGHFRQSGNYRSWRSRGTGDWLLIATVHGAGRFGYGPGELTAGPGDVVLLKPGTPHDYSVAASPGHWELLWAHVHPRVYWLQWLHWPKVAEGLLKLHVARPALRKRIFQRWEEARRLASRPRVGEALAMNALEQILIWCDAANPHSEQSRLDARIVQVMNQLAGQLHLPWNAEKMGELAGLSASRLTHLFAQQTGTTPQQYLQRQRLLRARQLLSLTDRSIKSIAYEVGYANPFYFSLRFKRLTQQNPTAFRLAHKRG